MSGKIEFTLKVTRRPSRFRIFVAVVAAAIASALGKDPDRTAKRITAWLLKSVKYEVVK